MPTCALPPHLRNKLHNDWPFPFNRFSRGSNAYGPRCGAGCTGFLPWPPRLVEGFGVARWELAGGGSIVELQSLANMKITAAQVYNTPWIGVERNVGHPNFGRASVITIPDPLTFNCIVTDMPKGDGTYEQVVSPNVYSPSPLQKFSRKGWMKLTPNYYSYWNILKWRELPWLKAGATGEEPEDTVLFYRRGNRPDPLDAYYNGESLLPIGYGGLKWE